MSYKFNPDQEDEVILEYWSGSSIRRTAKKFKVNPKTILSLLIRRGIPRRSRGVQAGSKRQRAYELRLSLMRWREIAKDLGLKHSASATNYARRYAESNDLKWPPIDYSLGRE